MAFWDDFELQHANFSEAGVQRAMGTLTPGFSKNFGTAVLPSQQAIAPAPAANTARAPGHGPGPVGQPMSATRISTSVRGGGGAVAGSAALSYNVALAANRWAVNYNLKKDIEELNCTIIRAMCPDVGGVLFGYYVLVLGKDPMGVNPVVYCGPPKFLAVGSDSLDAFIRGVNLPRQPHPTISAAKPGAVRRANIRAQHSDKVLKPCYAWIFRS
jgi:hypothetical protein